MRRMRACGERLRRRSLVFNLGFADQHYGYVIPYRVDTVALAALQPLPVVDDFHSGLAKRANEDLQQFRIHGHRTKW